jgi:hypothetical protein
MLDIFVKFALLAWITEVNLWSSCLMGTQGILGQFFQGQSHA